MTAITRLLIANRGEIVARIARTCAKLGITSVAIYSDADANALHVRSCDEAYRIGPAPASESYLRGEKIIELALAAKCDAVHPGYGFLSENAAFASAVVDAGLVWVGPTPEAIELMGSKIASKRLAERCGVPVVPGYFGDDQSNATLEREAERVGYPLLVKASAGGGGKGMRVVEEPGGLVEALEGAKREAQAAFGDSSVMLERYLAEPRHIEVQVLGDMHGSLIHLGERECSIQRRHQKVVEESPSPALDAELRSRITSSAVTLATAAGYVNAGTVEFIFERGEFYFLEMNTRLQVEHPVTEEAFGVDLVEAQIKIASGEPLAWTQDEIAFKRHAIEARLYAEDPERGFLPSTGAITGFHVPVTLGDTRMEAGVAAGDEVTPFYDPMIAKIITSGATRDAALSKMSEVLDKTRVEGVRTNLDFLRWTMAQPQMRAGELSTRFIERYYTAGAVVLAPVEVVLAGAALRLLGADLITGRDTESNPWLRLGWRQARQEMALPLLIGGQRYDVSISKRAGRPHTWNAHVSCRNESLFDGNVELALLANGSEGEGPRVRVALDTGGAVLMIGIGPSPRLNAFTLRWRQREYGVQVALGLSTETLSRIVKPADEDTLQSPMPGKVLKMLVSAGDEVRDEQPVAIIEAMKMEFTVRAPHDGKVATVHFSEGDQVAVGDILMEMEK